MDAYANDSDGLGGRYASRLFDTLDMRMAGQGGRMAHVTSPTSSKRRRGCCRRPYAVMGGDTCAMAMCRPAGCRTVEEDAKREVKNRRAPG